MTNRERLLDMLQKMTNRELAKVFDDSMGCPYSGECDGKCLQCWERYLGEESE